IVERWLAADEAERAEKAAERRAMGLPEPVSETEALQQRIAELEAENARLRGEDPKALPSPEASPRELTESELISPGEIPELNMNPKRGESWTGPADGTLNWLRPVPPVKPEDRPPATPPVAKSGDETKAQMARVNSDRSIEHR